MELFQMAKAVRLRSIHGKYLTAEEDEESVKQDRSGSSRNARWTVEFTDHHHLIRLKSCYGKYLTSSDQPFLLGMTGHKVTQTSSSTEYWEPIRVDSSSSLVKLKSGRQGNFLRANSGVPPWRNSVTHDVPYRSSRQEWIVWRVDVVEIVDHVPDEVAEIVDRVPSDDEPNKMTPHHRQIYYHVADEYGNVINDDYPGYSLIFKGKSVEELTRKLQEETNMDDFIVCTRSPLNNNLYPLRLHLPPNNATINVVLVQESSQVAIKFEAAGLL